MLSLATAISYDNLELEICLVNCSTARRTSLPKYYSRPSGLWRVGVKLSPASLHAAICAHAYIRFSRAREECAREARVNGVKDYGRGLISHALNKNLLTTRDQEAGESSSKQRKVKGKDINYKS